MATFTVLREAGCDEAMLGISLSYNQTVVRARAIAKKLAMKDGGHNKFLESIVVWIDIVAPRYWWQEFDTYRVGVTKQSESTMHTLMKRQLDQNDFANTIPGSILIILNKLISINKLKKAKSLLPESFLQRRIVCTNYKALRHMISQRKGHKLQEWQDFIVAMYDQLLYHDFVR